MAASNQPSNAAAKSGKDNFGEREVTITRVFDAPRSHVFAAWTDPEQLAQWWGPKGFTNPVCEADARVGGAWHIVMRAPDGSEYPCGGVYLEIVTPERLVFTNIAIDKEGHPIIDGLTTVTFAEEAGKTKLTLKTRGTAVVSYAAQYLQGMEAGWTMSLERLGALVAAPKPTAPEEGKEFVVSRTFDAPRDLVWKAWTEPERLTQWWGPKGFTMLATKLDLRPGGTFHYCMRAPNGMEMWGKFVYREVVPPARMVFINSFSDEKGNVTRHFASPTWPLEVLNTLLFDEQQGKTTITLKGYPINATEEERKTYEAGFDSMQKGFAGTLDQLAEYLARV